LLFFFSCVLCLSWFLFFHRLADRDLWSSHEARAGQDAQTILDDGAWGLPRLFDGQPELQKPPLYYWLVAAVARVRSGTVDAWAVRLPAALAALGGVVAVLLFGWRCGRPLAGLAAAVVLATALHFTWLARVGRIDMPLTLTVGLAVGGLYLARSAGGKGRVWSSAWCLIAYLAVAAGLLLKGPIGAVLPAAAVIAHLLVEGELPAPWRLRRWGRLTCDLGLWWGVPFAAALALPWYAWANAHTGGEFFRVFFWHHNVERGLGGSAELAEHPWWFYGPRFAFDFLPWSPLLPLAAWFLLRRGRWRADPEARLGLAWLLAVVLLLSCARFKRADYLLPAFPGAALFLGCVAERCYLGWRRQEFGRLALVPAAVCLLPLVAAAAGWCVYVEHVLPRYEPEREQQRFAAEVRRHAPAPQRVLLFWTEAHALAFHLGRPLDILIQWEDLDARLARGDAEYVVMPPEVAERRAEFLHAVRLDEVLRNTDLAGRKHERPLVLLRARPPTEGADARPPAAAADSDPAGQRAAAVP
jgi:4-amino-4-deoxy-L-arabinose transferase-like glycosyltransferase